MSATTHPARRAPQPLPLWMQVQLLTQRLLDDLLATPAVLIGGLAFAIGVVVVGEGLFGSSVLASAAPHHDYLAFVLPAGVLSATIVSGTAGYMLVTDIEDGYLDRLLASPTSRLALVLAPMLVGAAYGAVQAVLVLVFGAFLGATPAAGLPGAATMWAIAVLWGLGVVGYMVVVALVSRDSQVVQLVDLLFLPLLFLSPIVVPRSELKGWVGAVADVNPTTYALEGMRALMLDGWRAAPLLSAFLIVGAFACAMLVAAAFAARWATSRG